MHQNVLEKELNSIITNLEESIIVKTNNCVTYSNRRGKKIVNYLHKLGNTTDHSQLLDLKVFEVQDIKGLQDSSINKESKTATE